MKYEQEEFDRHFKEEREELANLEYSDPLSDLDEEDEEMVECTCLLDDSLPCPVHDKEFQNEEI